MKYLDNYRKNAADMEKNPKGNSGGESGKDRKSIEKQIHPKRQRKKNLSVKTGLVIFIGGSKIGLGFRRGKMTSVGYPGGFHLIECIHV